MGYDIDFGWTGSIDEVVIGATKSEGGTRSVSHRIGGSATLPFLENRRAGSPLIAFELCDNPVFWPPIIRKLLRGPCRQSRRMGEDGGKNIPCRSRAALPDQHETAGLFRYRLYRKSGGDRALGNGSPPYHRREQRAEDRQRGVPVMWRSRAGRTPPPRDCRSRQVPQHRGCRPRLQPLRYRPVAHRCQPCKATQYPAAGDRRPARPYRHRPVHGCARVRFRVLVFRHGADPVFGLQGGQRSRNAHDLFFTGFPYHQGSA